MYFYMKKVMIDMDGVLCNFQKSYDEKFVKNKIEYPQSQYGFFRELEPIHNAIESVRKLQTKYDVWILTAPSVLNPLCYSEKREWIEKHFDIDLCYKLIISPDKSLIKGDFLIDDMNTNGQDCFDGEWIEFGGEQFKNWEVVCNYLNV